MFRLNLAPAPKRIPVTEIITAVENGLRNTNQTEAKLARMWSREHSLPMNLHPRSGKAMWMTLSRVTHRTNPTLNLNSIEPTNKFTIELEQEGSLPFLDTSVTRHNDGSLTTTVFRKKTHSDWYLDFDSHHPQAHKVAVV